MQTITGNGRLWVLAVCAVGAVLARAPRAEAQTAGTTRADDSAFKISPMNATNATNKRTSLRNFIWGFGGFPSTKMPSSHRQLTTSPVANLINLQRVEALTISMDAGQSTVAYHFLPVSRNNRLVIVHQGHACELDDGQDPNSAGIARTIRALVANGFSVLAMNMPNMRPANAELGLPQQCNGDHASLFNLTVSGGSPMKFFIEPVVVAMNFLGSTQSLVRYTDFNMVGLSGGGWTTTMAAAADPRIKLSFPVAGTVPLFLRVEPYSHDLEQFLPQLYGQRSPFIFGITGYPDLYVLGAMGTGRKQHQILNRHDDCCFGEPEHNAAVLGVSFDAAVRGYEARVKTAIGQVGSGAFRLIVDEASPFHMISNNAINNVIVPVLTGATPLSTSIHSVFSGNLCVDIPDNGRPFQNNDLVQIFQCHEGINQQFDFMSDGTIRTRSGGFCLDIPDFGRAPQNGDLMQIFQCHGGLNQQFDVLGDRSIKSRWTGGLCLDVPDFGRPAQNFDRLQVFQCHGSTNQQFDVNR